MSPSEYENLRFTLIGTLEGKSSTPYFDSDGNITIGIGFNLEPQKNRTAVMDEMGLAPNEQASINSLFGSPELQAIRNTGDDEDLAALFSKTIKPKLFFLADTSIKNLFNSFAEVKDAAAQKYTLVTTRSAERAVLTSLNYSAKYLPGLPKALLGPSLLNALKNISGIAWSDPNCV